MDPPVQINDPPVEIHLVVTPRLAVDSRRGLLLQREEARPQQLRREVVQQVGAACRTPGNPRDLGTNGMPSAFRR
jgi:hypothetical protein